MATTTYIETSHLLALEQSNPSETIVFTGNVAIVVGSIKQNFETHGRKEKLPSEAFWSATSVV